MVYRNVEGDPEPVFEGLDLSQEEEYALAKAEDRQPRCVHCGKPLDKILQTQYELLSWTWDKEAKRFQKHDNGDAEKPYCANCETKDWGFCDEEVYTFF